MLGNFHVRTDLALEARENFGEADVKIRGVRVESRREDEEKEIRTTLVKIETENGAQYHGKADRYLYHAGGAESFLARMRIITGRSLRSWHII